MRPEITAGPSEGTCSAFTALMNSERYKFCKVYPIKVQNYDNAKLVAAEDELNSVQQRIKTILLKLTFKLGKCLFFEHLKILLLNHYYMFDCYSYNAVWIGLSAPDPATGYVWSDGSPVS